MTELNMATAHQELEKEVMTSAESKSKIDFKTLRIATQVRELVLQGITLKNTFNAMEEVWLSLYTEDKKCLIVDMTATKVRAQLINLYAIKFIKYMNSIVGLDLVPLAQSVNPTAADFENRNPADQDWKLDSIILNIGSNKITNHEHMFRLMLINVFGVSEEFVKFSMDQTWEGLRSIILKTYDIDLGETEHAIGSPTLYIAEKALRGYVETPAMGYDVINTKAEL